MILIDIVIRNTGEQPIYEQIYSQIKAQILSGALREGELLPSIRALAKDLRISVITTKRAYEELEREGYIYSYTGKGSFVAAQNIELIKEEQLKKIEDKLREILKIASSLHLDIADIEKMLRLIFTEEQNG